MAKRSSIEIRGGRNHTFPVSAGLLEPRHVQAIDASSPWPIYLWFLNRVTRDEAHGEQFDGIVLNGKPVGIEQIAAELGMTYRTCRRRLAHLVQKGYIVQKKTGKGMCSYVVSKSTKWAWKRNGKASEPTDQNWASGSTDPQTRIGPVGRDPETSLGPSTDQNRASAIRKKPQETTKIYKPQSSLVLSSRIPDDIALTQEHRGLAHKLGVDADYEFQKFRDYWVAQPGQKGRKCNWDATLRNWLRKASEMNNGGRKSSSRHVGLDKVDYTRGLREQNPDGTYKF